MGNFKILQPIDECSHHKGILLKVNCKFLLIYLISVLILACCADSPKQDDLKTDSLPPKRAHHGLIYDEANKNILMTSGSTPLNGGQSFKFYNDIWKFNNAQWSQVTTTGDERSGIRLAYDSKRNRIFSYGGFNGSSSLSDLRILDGNEWKLLSNAPEMKTAESGFVYDINRDKLIAFGGSASRGQVNNTTWEWDGSTWTKFNGSGPEGRQAFVMVYDSKRMRTVLYGGMGTSPGQVFGDTWEFDGKIWTKITDTGPGPRTGAGYTYDSNRGLLILFGGDDASGTTHNDTWGWNGVVWTKLSDAGPTARVMGNLAYDKDRDKIVLFGGRPSWPNDVNDTWEWDGTQWTEVKF